MFRGNWLHHATIRGCLIAAAIFVWSNNSYAIGKPNDAQEYRYADYQQYASVRPPLEGIAKFVGPEDADSPCQESQGGPKTDLCQQWRMANAAENQADWSALQVILSVIGVGGLIATIIYTHKTFRLTRFTAKRELRAYLVVTFNHMFSFDTEHPIHLKFEIRNVGQTPAFNVQTASTIIIVARDLSDDFEFPSAGEPGPATVSFPNHSYEGNVMLNTPVPEHLITAFQEDTARICAYTCVTYDDVFGDSHFTKMGVSPLADKAGRIKLTKGEGEGVKIDFYHITKLIDAS